MPAGALVRVPLRGRALLSVRVLGCRSKLAVTVVVAVRVTVQEPVPEHPPPLQPVKVEPVAEAAVRGTAVPLGEVAQQLAPQLMPAGALGTGPPPGPAFPTPGPDGGAVG